MNFFLETLKVLFLTIYLIFESIILWFIPSRRKNVAGELVLITGAGSGIGRLIALEFARLGATLVLWDINEEGNKETCRLAKKNGAVRVHTYTCDCSKREDVYRVADQVCPLCIHKPKYSYPFLSGCFICMFRHFLLTKIATK